jgi:hypothetical protein
VLIALLCNLYMSFRLLFILNVESTLAAVSAAVRAFCLLQCGGAGFAVSYQSLLEGWAAAKWAAMSSIPGIVDG